MRRGVVLAVVLLFLLVSFFVFDLLGLLPVT